MTSSIRTAVILTALLGCLGFSPHSQAKRSEPAASTHTLGADFLLVVPVGKYADASGVGFGLLARYELRLMSAFALTGRFGFVGHAAHKPGGSLKYRTWELPLLVGGRYYSKIGIWAGAELGLVVMGFRGSSAFGGPSYTDTDPKFGMMFSGGYRWQDLDFGLALFVPDIDDFIGITFTVGYSFAHFGKRK